MHGSLALFYRYLCRGKDKLPQAVRQQKTFQHSILP